MKIILYIVSNRKNTKGLFIIIVFRISHFFTQNIYLKVIGLPFRIMYKFFIEWVLGIEIPDTLVIGSGVRVFHGQGQIINKSARIGSFVTLRHNTTIGNSVSMGKSPIIEDYVNIGANCVIIGNISIGKNSIIGAGSVVIKSVPAYSVAVGNPAKYYSKENL